MPTTLLDALAARTLSKEVLHAIAAELAEAATKRLSGEADDARKAWCVAQLTAVLAHFDNAREVLGVIADLPLSARVERWAVRKVVEYAFLKQLEVADEPVPSLAPRPDPSPAPSAPSPSV